MRRRSRLKTAPCAMISSVWTGILLVRLGVMGHQLSPEVCCQGACEEVRDPDREGATTYT
jgi:hypothetical protein